MYPAHDEQRQQRKPPLVPEICSVILGETVLEIPRLVVAKLRPPGRGGRGHICKDCSPSSSHNHLFCAAVRSVYHHGPPSDQLVKPNGLQPGVQRGEGGSVVDRRAAGQRREFDGREGLPGGGGGDPAAPAGNRTSTADSVWKRGTASRMADTDHRRRRYVSFPENDVRLGFYLKKRRKQFGFRCRL